MYLKRVFTLCLLLIVATCVFSQNHLQVHYDYDAMGNANFIADNYMAVPVFVVLDFSFLEYASFSEELPFIKRVEPGTTPLFTIFREPDQPSPHFNIEYKWYMSHPSPETDSHFPHLIPGRNGSSVKIADIKQLIKSRMVGFDLLNSGKVYASRKGVVRNLYENADPRFRMEDSRKQNFIHILHDDGTIGEYINFKYKGINCEIGQKVIPGQELGMAENGPDGYPLIGFGVFHNDLYSENLRYLVPEFYQENEGVSQLSVSGEYKVVHPEELIIKELSRKERRALKKK